METQDEVGDWLCELQDPDTREAAAAKIFSRYFRQVSAVALTWLSESLQRRVDESRVVSAFRSVFRRIGDGEYTPEDASEFERLIYWVTRNKIRKAGRYHTALKRDHRREVHAADPDARHGIVFAEADVIAMARRCRERERVEEDIRSLSEIVSDEAPPEVVATFYAMLSGLTDDEEAIERDCPVGVIRRRREWLIDLLKAKTSQFD